MRAILEARVEDPRLTRSETRPCRFCPELENDESFDQTLAAGFDEEEVDPDLDNNSMSSTDHLDSAANPDENKSGSDEPSGCAKTLTSTSKSHEPGQNCNLRASKEEVQFITAQVRALISVLKNGGE
jgi:hypothetical protein